LQVIICSFRKMDSVEGEIECFACK
jgi:hypothetical protein